HCLERKEKGMHVMAPERTAPQFSRGRTGDIDSNPREGTELLANVSHEMGNLLTVIRSNVTLIRRSLESHGGRPDSLSQRCDDAQIAIERLLSLREQLLAASRNEPLQLEIRPTHLRRSLQRACRWARVAARDKGIDLTEEYA